MSERFPSSRIEIKEVLSPEARAKAERSLGSKVTSSIFENPAGIGAQELMDGALSSEARAKFAARVNAHDKALDSLSDQYDLNVSREIYRAGREGSDFEVGARH